MITKNEELIKTTMQNIKDNELLSSVKNSNEKRFEILIKNGANPNIHDEKGNNILHYANENMFRLIVDNVELDILQNLAFEKNEKEITPQILNSKIFQNELNINRSFQTKVDEEEKNGEILDYDFRNFLNLTKNKNSKIYTTAEAKNIKKILVQNFKDEFKNEKYEKIKLLWTYNLASQDIVPTIYAYKNQKLVNYKEFISAEEILKESLSFLEKNENDELKKSLESHLTVKLRTTAAPHKTGIGYKVFVEKNGKLYPPMVANPGGSDTPIGVLIDASAKEISSYTKTGRPQVQKGGDGTSTSTGNLAFRPGWHLGELPIAEQFDKVDKNGKKQLFPKDFVFAEVEYSNDIDYQEQAMKEGLTENGNFRHSYAGLKELPKDGAYKYRTNPDPKTEPWIIAGSMKVNRVLSSDEVDEIVRKANRNPQQKEEKTKHKSTVRPKFRKIKSEAKK